MLMNKVSFYAYARQLGIQTPRTFGLHNRADAEQVAGELAPGTKGGG
jgi:predicted ATP-grasp superfamily ATP-dependent carboligase